MCEEQAQEMMEMKKPYQEVTFLGLRGVKMGLKSRDAQKAHLRRLLSVHT